MIQDRGIVAGNVTDKYAARNPIMRLLMTNFLRHVGELYQSIPAYCALEVGCGEGELARHLLRLRPASLVATDVSPKILAEAARRGNDGLRFLAHSVTALGFADDSFDLVLACEVLEHLADPLAALDEICRVSRRYVIISVPREPLWRALNVARGAYLGQLGNTPGHVKHWSRSGIVNFVSRRLRVLEVRNPLPWTMLLAEVQRAA
jgi:ubiquinone/menaquinone biosynthesis C-methylase UbiE